MMLRPTKFMPDINQFTLDQRAGEYTALSYTCGSPDEDFIKLREQPHAIAQSPHDIQLNVVPQELLDVNRCNDDVAAAVAGASMLNLYRTPVGTIPVGHSLSDWFKAYLDGWPQKHISKCKRMPNLSEIFVFWIDTICSDQHDKVQEAQQIPLMGETFPSAARVLGWSGPSTTGL